MKTRYAFLSMFGLVAIAASSPASGNTFTTLDYPGALDTYPHGVSGGTVVGSYQNSSPNTAFHGFSYNGSTFATLDFPGATGTVAQDVSGSTVVGSYTDSAHLNHGFIYNGSTFMTLDVPGAAGTAPLAVSGGTVV